MSDVTDVDGVYNLEAVSEEDSAAIQTTALELEPASREGRQRIINGEEDSVCHETATRKKWICPLIAPPMSSIISPLTTVAAFANRDYYNGIDGPADMSVGVDAFQTVFGLENDITTYDAVVGASLNEPEGVLLMKLHHIIHNTALISAKMVHRNKSKGCELIYQAFGHIIRIISDEIKESSDPETARRQSRRQLMQLLDDGSLEGLVQTGVNFTEPAVIKEVILTSVDIGKAEEADMPEPPQEDNEVIDIAEETWLNTVTEVISDANTKVEQSVVETKEEDGGTSFLVALAQVSEVVDDSVTVTVEQFISGEITETEVVEQVQESIEKSDEVELEGEVNIPPQFLPSPPPVDNGNNNNNDNNDDDKKVEEPMKGGGNVWDENEEIFGAVIGAVCAILFCTSLYIYHRKRIQSVKDSRGRSIHSQESDEEMEVEDIMDKLQKEYDDFYGPSEVNVDEYLKRQKHEGHRTHPIPLSPSRTV